VWRSGAWHAATPPDRVEGPAADLPAETASALPSKESSEGEKAPLGLAVVTAVSAIGTSYRAGILSSDAAEAALSQLYTVDRNGGVWTVGVQSGRWHRFHNGAWQREDRLPDPATFHDGAALYAADSSPEVVAGLAEFVASGDPLPEPITEPWLAVDEPKPAVTWKPTHRVPAAGLSVWESPDAAAAPFGSVAAGLEVEVVEQSGAWAHVRRPGGWAGWVDGRLLIALS
jgi:hypothetical protein